MPIGLDTFRNITPDRGYLKQTDAQALEVFGDHAVFGKIGKAVFKPGEQANQILHSQFFAAVKQEFGSSFAAYHQARIAGRHDGLLSVADVKDILTQGDLRAERHAQIKDQVIRTDVDRNAQAFSLTDLRGGDNALKPVLTGVLAEMGLKTFVDRTNANAADHDTHLSVSGTSFYTADQAKDIDARIRQGLMDAHGGATTPLMSEQVVDVARNVLKNDPALARKLEVLQALGEKGLTGADLDFATDGLIRNTYGTIDEFMVRSGRAEPGSKGHAPMAQATGPGKSYVNEMLAGKLGEARPLDASYDPRAFFAGIQQQAPKQGVADTRAFDLNKAALMHFAQAVQAEDPSTARTLGQRSLGYLTKFTPMQREDGHDRNLVVKEGKGDSYTRGGGNAMMNIVREQAGKAFGVSEHNLTPVTDGRIIDVISREMEQSGMGAVLEWDENGLDGIFEKLIGSENPVFVDVSDFMAGTLFGHAHDREELHMAREVADGFLSDVLDAHAEDYVARRNDTLPEGEKLSLDTVKKQMGERVVLGSIIRVGSQDALYTTSPSTRLPNGQLETVNMGAKILPGNENFVPAKPGDLPPTYAKMFKEMVAHNGFTVGPNQLLENMIDALSGEKNATGAMTAMFAMLAPVEIAPNFAGTDGAGLARFDSVEAFLGTRFMTECAALSGEGGSDVPMFKTLAGVTMRMLEGFKEIDLFDKMAQKGLGDLLTYELNHIQAGVQAALTSVAQGDQNAFLGAMNLIQADIANLVALAAPFVEGSFNDVMQEVAGYSDVLAPGGIKPEFMLKNSGMRGLASVISGLENMAGRNGEPLQVAVLENSYYESQINLGHAKGNTTFTVSDTYHVGSIGEIGQKLGESGKKLDLFVAEFHHNIGVGVSEYADLDVLGQVKSLIANDLVSDRFTVAIDNTISDPDGAEIRSLLSDPVIARAIEEGKLNVVFYRSAQKFDMAGFDNYNGGITASFNKAEVFGDFMDGMRKTGDEGDKISNFNMQGLTYFQKTARAELSQYRNGIVANTRKLLDPRTETKPDGFSAETFLTPETMGKRFFQVTPNSDAGAVFVDLRSAFFDPDDPQSEEGYSALFNLVNQYVVLPGKDMPLQGRASFGFAHANVSTIGGDRFRFNPGLESNATIVAYREMFDTINDAMSLVDYPDASGADISKQAFKMLAVLGGDASLLDILGKAGRGEALDLAETEAAVSALVLRDLHGPATTLLEQFQTRMLAGTPAEMQQLSDLANTVQPPAVTVSERDFANGAIGLRDALISPGLDRLSVRAMLGTLTGQALALGGDLVTRITAQVTNGFEFMSQSMLERIGGALDGLVNSLPREGDARMEVATRLKERVATLIEAKAASAHPVPGTPAQRMDGHFAAMMIEEGDEGISHGFGLLQTEMNAMIGSQTGALAAPELAGSPFGRLAAAMRPALNAIGTDQAILSSPEVQSALNRFARDHHSEVVGLTPNSGATLSLVNFLPQGFVRNMQFGLAEMFRTATKDVATEEAEASQRSRVVDQATELQQKTVSAVSNLKMLSTIVMHPDFLDMVPPQEREVVEQFGASLGGILSEVTRGPDNLLVKLSNFANDVIEDPAAFLDRF
jgi:hypothetical protein